MAGPFSKIIRLCVSIESFAFNQKGQVPSIYPVTVQGRCICHNTWPKPKQLINSWQQGLKQYLCKFWNPFKNSSFCVFYGKREQHGRMGDSSPALFHEAHYAMSPHFNCKKGFLQTYILCFAWKSHPATGTLSICRRLLNFSKICPTLGYVLSTHLEQLLFFDY